MKKLIGRIFRDENGVETIEREPEIIERYISKWKMEREEGGVLNMTCPKYTYRTRFQTTEVLDSMVNALPIKGWPTKNYCSFCGSHNIIAKEIEPF